MDNDSYSKSTTLLLQSVLDNTGSSIMLLKPIRGASGAIVDFEYLHANMQTLNSVVADSLVGKYMTHQFPELKGSPLLNSYARVMETGESFKDVVDITPYGIPVYAQIYASKKGDSLLVTYFDITERIKLDREILRLKEEVAQKAEDKYHGLFNSMQEGFCLIEMMYDENGSAWNFRYLEVNPAFTKHTGVAIEYGKTVRDYAPSVSKAFLDIYAEVARTGNPAEFTYFAETRGRWFELHASRFGGPESKEVAVIFNDVSGRKTAEIALRQSEEKFRTLFESIEEGFLILEMIRADTGRAIDFRLIEVNPAFIRQTGLGAVTVGKLASEYVPNLEQFWVDTFDRVARTGTPEHVENYNHATNRWYKLHISRVGDGNRRVAVLFENVTERRQREQHQQFLVKLSDGLRAEPDADAIANRAVRMLAEHLHLDRCYVGIALLDDNRGIFPYQYGNDRVAPMPDDGISLSDFPDALRTTSDKTLVITDFQNMEGFTEEEKHKFAALGFGALIVANVRKEGKKSYWSLNAVSAAPRKWTDIEIQLVEEATERAWGALERARAEGALRQSEAHLSAVFDVLPVGISVVDTAGKTILFNSAMSRFLPERIIPSRDKNVAKRWQSFNPDGSLVEPHNYPSARALRGETVLPGMEFLFSETDGKKIWTLVSSVPIRNEYGKVVEAMSLVTDINDLKRTSEDLRELNENLEKTINKRTEELTKLELAREKDRLNAILLGQEMERTRIGEALHNGVAQLLIAVQNKLQEHPAGDELAAGNLKSAISILSEAIRETRNISFELMPPILKDYGLKAALVKFINRIFNDNIQIRLSIELSKRLSESLEMSIYRIFQEILSNIKKHSEATVAFIEISEGKNRILLRSKDNGKGFQMKDVSKQQKGMGLQNIRHRTKLLGGKLKVTSKPGSGTLTEIWLPIDGNKPGTTSS